ncbi:transcription factor Adf-1 [Aplysia californica]|uniref:Transcription factor Adf-1 n=1 Tax=Aplysia californica TaxID=6500 RepID=A0ABM0JKS4_APLCA|nr:transcription factor Adf-1 [Aplysia californica]
MEAEALIEAVRKREVLFDKSNENYSNRVVINQQWIEFGEEVGIDGATARKKWAMLRDSFRRQHKKETTYKSGSGGKYQKLWYLYKDMLFLIPFVEDGNTSTTNLIEGPEDEQELQQASQLREDNVETIANTDVFSRGGSPFTNPQPGPSHTPDITNSSATPKRHARKRPYPPYPQDRGSRSTSPSAFDIAILQSLKGLQQQQTQNHPRTMTNSSC